MSNGNVLSFTVGATSNTVGAGPEKSRSGAHTVAILPKPLARHAYRHACARVRATWQAIYGSAGWPCPARARRRVRRMWKQAQLTPAQGVAVAWCRDALSPTTEAQDIK